ncbi:NUDIX domain-containing protein [Empedobacter falsenii]|uniref:NUDIX hydrolase n=1 Tax=Empedobacter falsenii TaxID=343874 RepID=UPI002575FF2E|nr:NUDIX domain-containing protein [Empedobacter falsenii]MDM1297883.1 NUDIX domain-containing protein [Empedobacter falsenii]MDM1317489.1 NUDIX domain-containing protein [Empedobacter falsenii]
MIELPTAGLLVIKNNKLLLTFSKNKKAWYLPGGKIDKGENSETALVREIKEELSLDLVKEDLNFYCHITAEAYGEQNLLMEQDCFLYDLNEEIKPTNEIEAYNYFTFEEYLQEEIQVIGVIKVFEKLTKDHLLN